MQELETERICKNCFLKGAGQFDGPKNLRILWSKTKVHI